MKKPQNKIALRLRLVLTVAIKLHILPRLQSLYQSCFMFDFNNLAHFEDISDGFRSC